MSRWLKERDVEQEIVSFSDYRTGQWLNGQDVSDDTYWKRDIGEIDTYTCHDDVYIQCEVVEFDEEQYVIDSEDEENDMTNKIGYICQDCETLTPRNQGAFFDDEIFVCVSCIAKQIRI